MSKTVTYPPHIREMEKETGTHIPSKKSFGHRPGLNSYFCLDPRAHAILLPFRARSSLDRACNRNADIRVRESDSLSFPPPPSLSLSSVERHRAPRRRRRRRRRWVTWTRLNRRKDHSDWIGKPENSGGERLCSTVEKRTVTTRAQI